MLFDCSFIPCWPETSSKVNAGASGGMFRPLLGGGRHLLLRVPQDARGDHRISAREEASFDDEYGRAAPLTFQECEDRTRRKIPGRCNRPGPPRGKVNGQESCAHVAPAGQRHVIEFRRALGVEGSLSSARCGSRTPRMRESSPPPQGESAHRLVYSIRATCDHQVDARHEAGRSIRTCLNCS